MTVNNRHGGALFTYCALAILVFSSSVHADEYSDEKVVLTAMLHEFLKNSATEDAHAKFWAEELVYTSSNGTRFGKADIMQGFAKEDSEESDASAEADDAPQIVFSGEDVNIQVFGSTAIVTFRLVGTPIDGSDLLQYFNSGTFLKRHGSWQAVNWQATIIPADES